MPVRFSEFCAQLTSRVGEQHTAAGLFHRLTGKSYRLDTAALAFLEDVTALGLDLDDVDDPSAREFLERLRGDGFLISDDDPSTASGVPAGWADYRLHQPIHNPAIVACLGDGRWVAIRNDDLGVCHIPRTQWRPQVHWDALSDTSVRLLRSAAQRVTWSAAQKALLGSGVAAAEINEALTFLTDPSRQLLRLRPPDADLYDLDADFQSPRQSFVFGGHRPNPAAGHYADISDAADNFDWLETTVAHAFRAPTSTLGGRTFGARVAGYYADWLSTRVRDRGAVNVLEVGGGLGYFAASFLQALVEAGIDQDRVEYTILDCSPALLRAQGARDGAAPKLLQGDAQAGLPPGEYDLVIANEVIADFDVEGCGEDLTQSGAIAFLKETARHLAPGGRAYISEYGEMDAPPARVEHLEHVEYSIHFRPLLSLATELGLHAALIPMAEILAPIPHTQLLIGQHERYLCLDALLRRRGGKLEYRVYDRADFESSFKTILQGCEILSPLFAEFRGELHFGPRISQFKVLELGAAADAPNRAAASSEAPSSPASVLAAAPAASR